LLLSLSKYYYYYYLSCKQLFIVGNPNTVENDRWWIFRMAQKTHNWTKSWHCDVVHA